MEIKRINHDKKMPKFNSLDALTEFFDEIDMGDYLDDMPEADFDVNLSVRIKNIVNLDE